MTELSSCYFCRAALDAPLRRYTLSASGDEETTVVLCPTCRRKLVGVLERTLVADPTAEADTLLSAAADAEGDRAGTATEPTVADVTPDQGSAGRTEQAAPDDRSGAAASPDDAGDRGVDATDAAAGSRSRTTAAGDGTPIFDGAEDADQDRDTDAVFGSGDTASEGTADRDGDDGAGGAPAAETGDDSGRGDAGAIQVDTATYNRVVRLLQNRAFPVRTADIREVAVNAYDIDPADFRAAIDAAVDRGVLVEDDDQLDRST